MNSKKPKRWQDDAGFCHWLKRAKYEALSSSTKIYMWEAYREGLLGLGDREVTS